MRIDVVMSRLVLNGLIGLSLAAGAPAFAADPVLPRVQTHPVQADPVQADPVPVEPLPPATVLPVLPPLVNAIDPRTGRCLAGFALDREGFCRRHDDPPIVCPEPDLCGAGPPSLAPYGIGPALRLNY